MIDPNVVVIPDRFKKHPVFTTLHRGVNFGFMSKRGYYSQPETLSQPAKMAASGVNWSTLNANFCQETFHSTKVFLDFTFSSGERELADMIKRLHDNGIHVLLKPCLTPLDSAWMGAINFPEGKQIQGVESHYWQDWFASFTDASKYFAEFAENNKVESLIIGAEYYGTERRSDDWLKVIAAVRDIFSGPITYEFIPSSRKNYRLDWFQELDFLSYSYYPPACPCNAEDIDHADARSNPSYTVEEMVDYLSSRKEKIYSICERFGKKPIAFTEIGVRSAHGCIMQPYNYLWDSYYDPEEQANYMEAVFRTFFEMPQWMGMYWWKWDETQLRPHYHTDPNGDLGFTIEGKSAARVMKNWFSNDDN